MVRYSKAALAFSDGSHLALDPLLKLSTFEQYLRGAKINFSTNIFKCLKTIVKRYTLARLCGQNCCTCFSMHFQSTTHVKKKKNWGHSYHLSKLLSRTKDSLDELYSPRRWLLWLSKAELRQTYKAYSAVSLHVKYKNHLRFICSHKWWVKMHNVLAEYRYDRNRDRLIPLCDGQKFWQSSSQIYWTSHSFLISRNKPKINLIKATTFTLTEVFIAA